MDLSYPFTNELAPPPHDDSWWTFLAPSGPNAKSVYYHPDTGRFAIMAFGESMAEFSSSFLLQHWPFLNELNAIKQPIDDDIQSYTTGERWFVSMNCSFVYLVVDANDLLSPEQTVTIPVNRVNAEYYLRIAYENSSNWAGFETLIKVNDIRVTFQSLLEFLGDGLLDF